MKRIKELLIKYKELISYLFFGVATTLVNWLVYAVMVRLLAVDLSAVSAQKGQLIKEVFHGAAGKNLILLFVASLVAWVVAVIFAFVTNKLWVFASKSFRPAVVLKELWGFVAARLATGAMEWFGIPALVLAGMNQKLFGVEGFWAKALVSVAVVVLNYVFSKFLIFKNNTKNEE